MQITLVAISGPWGASDVTAAGTGLNHSVVLAGVPLLSAFNTHISIIFKVGDRPPDGGSRRITLPRAQNKTSSTYHVRPSES